MKKFLQKISVYLLGIIVLHAVLGSYADGNTDDNYMHFAVPKPQNIIMGDSRGSQAVVSGVLGDKLSGKFDNFSLNIVQSPYGKIYFEALKKKIDPETKEGIFILTVDPWNLALHNRVKNEEEFPEQKSPFKSMQYYSMSPNYEYLLRNYRRSWFKIYLERAEVGRSNTFLHDDGWMEVNISMAKDSVKIRTEKKIEFYRKLAADHHQSEERLTAFKNIITFLQKKGKVYIVRIPAAQGITKIEDEKFPDFNNMMKSVALKYSIDYFNFSKDYGNYTYTDGNHMHKESSKVFSAQIADSILQSRRLK
ncbi:hypothetical protein [Chryseobacterium caseinilyticum]|nr:hypothetical protein [Chryseobacterium caseinilyticum]